LRVFFRFKFALRKKQKKEAYAMDIQFPCRTTNLAARLRATMGAFKVVSTRAQNATK
jgi:hypothetical protein